jgi:hypothetical protein
MKINYNRINQLKTKLQKCKQRDRDRNSTSYSTGKLDFINFIKLPQTYCISKTRMTATINSTKTTANCLHNLNTAYILQIVYENIAVHTYIGRLSGTILSAN